MEDGGIEGVLEGYQDASWGDYVGHSLSPGWAHGGRKGTKELVVKKFIKNPNSQPQAQCLHDEQEVTERRKEMTRGIQYNHKQHHKSPP